MEIFVDGGLFELVIATALGYTINYIFLKKYLLIIFSAISISSPIALLFFQTGELFYWLISVCIINGILLVILLWKQREKFPNQPLFDVEKFRRKFFNKTFYKQKFMQSDGSSLKK